MTRPVGVIALSNLLGVAGRLVKSPSSGSGLFVETKEYDPLAKHRAVSLVWRLHVTTHDIAGCVSQPLYTKS